MEYWFGPTSPLDLGVSRALTYGFMSIYFGPTDFAGWSLLPEVFWMPTPLFELLGRPGSWIVLEIMEWIWKVSLLTAGLGLWTRQSSIIACALGTYLLGLPHCFGKTSHNDAAVVLVFLVLACSRCGDAFSLDAQRAKQGGSAASGEYRWPIRMVWVILCGVFFLAGASKLTLAGPGWAGAESIAITLVGCHYYESLPPTEWGLALAQSPLATGLIGWGTLGLELVMPLALFHRVPRAVLPAAGFLMLVGIRLVMGPEFYPLMALFVFWVPWSRLRRTPITQT